MLARTNRRVQRRFKRCPLLLELITQHCSPNAPLAAHNIHHRTLKRKSKCEFTGTKRNLIQGQFVYKGANGTFHTTRWYTYRQWIATVLVGLITINHPETPQDDQMKYCMKLLRALCKRQ